MSLFIAHDNKCVNERSGVAPEPQMPVVVNETCHSKALQSIDEDESDSEDSQRTHASSGSTQPQRTATPPLTDKPYKCHHPSEDVRGRRMDCLEKKNADKKAMMLRLSCLAWHQHTAG